MLPPNKQKFGTLLPTRLKIVCIPNIETQRRIAAVLAALDQKIALNRKTNQTLENMAKQLYDYYFVQFCFPDNNGKPYKASGSKMVYNATLKREVPEGWEVKNLGVLCNFRNGINYSKNEKGQEYPIVNVRNISATNILLDGEKFDLITVAPSKASNYILSENDIIIARSGCPGATRILYSPNNTLFCGFIICCTPNEIQNRFYLTYLLKQLEGTSATKSGGSILLNVCQDTLKNLKILVPPQVILDNFNVFIRPLIVKMKTNLEQIARLTALRDELLPLLMNGQVQCKIELETIDKDSHE